MPLLNEVALGLDYWWISWPTTGYSIIFNHWKSQQARHSRDRLEWRCQNPVYFPACNAIVMSKIEVRPGCTRAEGRISARETNKNEKGISYKLEQGLNFTVNVDFWFYSDDFYKNPEGKKTWFLSFSYDFLFLSKFESGYFAKRDDLFAFIEYPILRDILPSDHNW